MVLRNPSGGPDWAAEYLVSPVPWVTSSTVTGIKSHTFGSTELSGSKAFNEFVTRWLIVRNDDASELRVSFTELGMVSSSNYMTLEVSESFSADVRVKEVFLSGSGNKYQLVAGITGVHARHMADITGSKGFPGVG